MLISYSTRFGEFYAGLLHPLTTLVHFIPWVAFGFFCSLQNREVVRRCVWLFPLSVGIGVFLENHPTRRHEYRLHAYECRIFSVYWCFVNPSSKTFH